MDHTVLPAKKHHACLSFLSVHQMSPPQQLRQRTSNCNSLLIYRPRKAERLSWPSWLTYGGWFNHISGHPSATGRAQDSESTPAKDRCSTAGSNSCVARPFCDSWATCTKGRPKIISYKNLSTGVLQSSVYSLKPVKRKHKRTTKY